MELKDEMKRQEMKDEKPTDYRAFFVIGTSLIAVGVSLMSAVGLAMLGLLGAGVVFMMIGLTNWDKSTKSRKETA